jgi:hypothetical protein
LAAVFLGRLRSEKSGWNGGTEDLAEFGKGGSLGKLGEGLRQAGHGRLSEKKRAESGEKRRGVSHTHKYCYLSLDSKNKRRETMKNLPLSVREIRRLEARYRSLAAGLGQFESMSQGSVMPQAPRSWIWTRKVAGKTVTRGLSPEKAQQMKQAIANYRQLEKMIEEMREITQNLILNAPENTANSRAPKRPKSVLS